MTRAFLAAAVVAGGCLVGALWLLGVALMDLGADFDPDPWGDGDD